ncbi:MAG: acyltransferase [Deltaproteobacteria bacterium]|nr:acyltransferase [Deltaproteobacteria bacterium]
MLQQLISALRGILSLVLYLGNTLFWFPLVMITALSKLVVPIPAWRRLTARALNGMADGWVAVNRWHQNLTQPTTWDVQGLEGLRRRGWYLVMSNHQSWVDILVLQYVFHRKIPMLKFFIKQGLIWMPFLGLAWWAMEFPFMKRYSAAKLAKKPWLKGKDLEITQKACAKFRSIPIAVMNFVEGTRFTTHKQERQESPFARLLRPKAGGVATVMGALGEQLDSILNVTISYPQGAVKFWHFLSGKLTEVKVRVEHLPVTRDLLGNYAEDGEYRARFQTWLNELWAEKDRMLSQLALPPAPVPVVVPRERD